MGAEDEVVWDTLGGLRAVVSKLERIHVINTSIDSHHATICILLEEIQLKPFLEQVYLLSGICFGVVGEIILLQKNYNTWLQD